MGFRHGVQSEVLVSLAVVMLTATGLLAGIFLEVNSARLESLHSLLGRGFVAVASTPNFEVHAPAEGSWWRMDANERVTGLNASSGEIDSESKGLGLEAVRLGQPMIRSGAPWSAIRFAAPRTAGRSVIVGRIDAPVSGTVLVGLLVTDVLIFGLFGVTLLRRRVVGPLHRLSAAVREIGEADLPAVVPVEGTVEIEELGSAFNEMQEALAHRTGALEKAVVELRETNARLVQAREGLDRNERLAMVGSLAAGVAHEVGNPMGALLAFLDLAERDEGLGEEGRRCLARASEQGERVRLILRQLLDFSRPPRVEHVELELGPIVHQAVELISAQKVFASIHCDVELQEGHDKAYGDASLVSQILLNLGLNAAAAIEGAENGRLRFSVQEGAARRRASDAETGAELDRNRADAVFCRVEDSGPGVSTEDRERIFDPFFTTKAPGEGTGLGLANARRLAQEMGGDVVLEDRPSDLGGASFVLRLPQPGSDDRRSPGLASGAAQIRAEA